MLGDIPVEELRDIVRYLKAHYTLRRRRIRRKLCKEQLSKLQPVPIKETTEKRWQVDHPKWVDGYVPICTEKLS